MINNNKEIYSNLKETWIQFENYPFENQKSILEDSKNKIKIIEIISEFQKTETIGGISLASFFKSVPKTTLDLKSNFIQNIPTLQEFKSFESVF